MKEQGTLTMPLENQAGGVEPLEEPLQQQGQHDTSAGIVDHKEEEDDVTPIDMDVVDDQAMEDEYQEMMQSKKGTLGVESHEGEDRNRDADLAGDAEMSKMKKQIAEEKRQAEEDKKNAEMKKIAEEERKAKAAEEKLQEEKKIVEEKKIAEEKRKVAEDRQAGKEGQAEGAKLEGE